MRNIVKLITVFTVLTSCQNEIQFNTPAFQGLKDSTTNLWSADSFGVTVNLDGSVIISGSNSSGTINLKLPFVEQDPNYAFVPGNGGLVEAQFLTPEGLEYSTSNLPDEQVSVYPELGAIYINEVDVVNATLSGTFRFIAFDASGLNSVSFTGTTTNTDQSGNPIYGGYFYKIPVVSGNIPLDPLTCDDATEAVTTTRANYLATFDGSQPFIDSAAYNSACSAYRQALVFQKNLCGDPDNSIQIIIDSLEDCQITCAQAIANRNEAQLQYLNSNTIDTCNNYVFYLNEQIAFCGDNSGNIQATINSLDCDDIDGDGVPNVEEDIDADDNFDNDDTDGDGTPDYLDLDDDGDNINTENEDIDSDGDPTNDDTDGDGMPNYLDTDDDGDNVSTLIEDIDGNGTPINDDTDLDGIPDYLDDDDDNDGILTINEDVNADGDPTNDDSDGDGIPDYLDAS